MKNFNLGKKIFQPRLKYNSFKFLTFWYNFTLLPFESRFLNSMEFLNSWKHFIRLLSLSLAHLKRACKVAIFIVFRINKEFARAQYRIFILGWKKCQLFGKFEILIPGWNSVYRIEIFTCNCNIILKRSFLFRRDEISTRYTALKFQPGLKNWKSPYNQLLRF